MAHPAARWRAWRELAVGLGIPLAAVILLPGPTTLLAAPTEAQPDAAIGAALLGIIGVAAWALTAWGAAVLVATLAASAPNGCGRVATLVLRRIAPAAIRRTAAIAVGVSLSVGIALPAHAAGVGSDATPPAAQVVADPAPSRPGELFPLGLDWVPAAAQSDAGSARDTWQAAARQRTAAASPASVPSVAAAQHGGSAPAAQPEPDAAGRTRTVIVQPGDCLWALAARELPPSATAAEIDAAWRAWYRANRQVIGADPNILIPGQQLAVPTAPAASAAPSPSQPGGIR